MTNKKNYSNHFTIRENFLMSLLSKITKEYKALLEITRRTKPLKIIEIIQLSTIPGETKFAVQVTNKNCVLHLTAADIINGGYHLHDFSQFHAEMIRKAAQGRLITFLKLTEKEVEYKIISKKFDREIQQYVFTIETSRGLSFTRTADELAEDKKTLSSMDLNDIYDIGYTKGSESILKEKTALLLSKNCC